MNGHIDKDLVCDNIALRGDLELLQWAREWGCPWDNAVCIKAAENGHLHILQWLREGGYP